MKRKMKLVALGGAVLAVAGLGLGAGAAAGVAPMLFAPLGLSTDTRTQPMPAPEYAENESGLTFGSAAEAASPDQEPDLIAAMATNGREGYVRKSDLDEANGSAAAAGFSSPEEALAWQAEQDALAERGGGDRTIPVYAQDGFTVIGEFLIAGP